MTLFERYVPVTWFVGRITFNGVVVHEARTVWVDGRTYLDHWRAAPREGTEEDK